MRACLRGLLFLGLSSFMHCDGHFWQSFSQVNPGNCVSEAASCDNGLSCNSVTQVCEPTPDVQSVMPNLAPGAGGTQVTVQGINFGPETTVSFGQSPSAPATNVTVISDTLLSATVPANPGTSWGVPVTVGAPGLSVSRSGLFSYYARSFSFSDMRLAPPSSVMALGDIDNDQQVDAVLFFDRSGNTSITILKGNGDGTFAVGPVSIAANQNVSSALLIDLNHDNYLDLITTYLQGANIYINNQKGGFASPQPMVTDPQAMMPNALSAAAGDFNQDGQPDLAIANLDAGSVTVLLNDGQGGFAPPVIIENSTGPEAVLCADFNGDTLPDLVTFSASTPVQVRLGDGHGNFPPGAAPSLSGCTPRHALEAELNGDGYLDLVVICVDHSVRVVLSTGAAQFASADTPFAVFNANPVVTVADFDGDGLKDLAIVSDNVISWILSVYRGDGHGNFATPYQLTTQPGILYDMRAPDLNHDAKPDLVVVSDSTAVELNTSH